MARRKRRPNLEYEDAELNIMPFIDVFSVLNTFLLFSAVFVALGVIKVQVPFFTSKDVDEPKRSLEVKVDARRDKILLLTNYSRPPRNEQQWQYDANEAGLLALHRRLVQIRSQNQETDLVTLLCDDDVKYEQVIRILDAIKNRTREDPIFANEEVSDQEAASLKNLVFPKVVMGSVVL